MSEAHPSPFPTALLLDTSFLRTIGGTDSGTVTVTVPPSADNRAFIEACEETLGTVSMTRRESVRGTGSMGDLRYDLEDIVTEKQFEALQAGFFKLGSEADSPPHRGRGGSRHSLPQIINY
jgi:hypothetical protein